MKRSKMKILLTRNKIVPKKRQKSLHMRKQKLKTYQATAMIPPKTIKMTIPRINKPQLQRKLCKIKTTQIKRSKSLTTKRMATINKMLTTIPMTLTLNKKKTRRKKKKK